jgi:hypothetical protein
MGVKALAKAEGGHGFLVLRNDGTAAVQVRLISLQPLANGAATQLPNKPSLEPGAPGTPIDVTRTLLGILRNVNQVTLRLRIMLDLIPEPPDQEGPREFLVTAAGDGIAVFECVS